MSWRGAAEAIIGRVHANLPADADLASRKKALRQARPYEFSQTSWGRKVWQKAQRSYLVKHGLKPRQKPPLSLGADDAPLFRKDEA